MTTVLTAFHPTVARNRSLPPVPQSCGLRCYTTMPQCRNAAMVHWAMERSSAMEARDTSTQSLLEVDSRRRISFGSLAMHDRYLVDVEEDGTIILTPAVVMSVAQARLFAAADTARRIDEFLDHPETGSRRTRPTRSRKR